MLPIEVLQFVNDNIGVYRVTYEETFGYNLPKFPKSLIDWSTKFSIASDTIIKEFCIENSLCLQNYFYYLTNKPVNFVTWELIHRYVLDGFIDLSYVQDLNLCMLSRSIFSELSENNEIIWNRSMKLVDNDLKYTCKNEKIRSCLGTIDNVLRCMPNIPDYKLYHINLANKSCSLLRNTTDILKNIKLYFSNLDIKCGLCDSDVFSLYVPIDAPLSRFTTMINILQYNFIEVKKGV